MTKTKWIIKSQSEATGDLAMVVLKNRGFDEEQIEHFLHPSYLTDLADPFLLPDMKAAVERILTAIELQQKIVIYGDYDIDGITASSLLYDFFQSAGAQSIEVYIPDRFEEGYGLNSAAIKDLKKSATDLVITVDCGVTAVVQAKLAKTIGLDLIITDHHEPLDDIPIGQIALVNPKLSTSKYPFRELAGVGVAFSLVRALLIQKPTLLKAGQEKWLLDLVALGTVCDVVPLVGENRALASFGLQVMRKTRRAGLKALAEVSATEISQVNESDLGFRFGPRLNAAGRLEHAKTALDLLLSTDLTQAHELAQKLSELNTERQSQTQEIFNQADMQAKKCGQDLVLVLADKSWSHGIVGIVASKIAEKWHKPTILLQILGDTCKGSARSYGDFSIIDGLNACSDTLIQFGGHSFAAGMKLKTENVELFSHTLNQYALKAINIESMLQRIEVDAVLHSEQLKLESVAVLGPLQPYGNENVQPVFSSTLELVEYRLIGQHLNHVKFRFITDKKNYIDGIAFSSAHKWSDLKTEQMYDIAYKLQENIWQDVARLQLEVIDIKPISAHS
ncbi:single-stranded-DNA-specific exonuclease RecJ [Candidatus Saccharibacteria bacterium]|nr:single-stranded-DNA-specific exonuclease RecJ [Candidatus Saccharibacteria bacterium]